MADTVEQTKVTAFSGVIILDETGAIHSHQIQYRMESPELVSDGKGGRTTGDTKAAERKHVTEILARTDAEAEQKLTELFVELPKPY